MAEVLSSVIEIPIPTLHQPLHSKVSNYLNDQRRTGQFCDLIIELENGGDDAGFFAHYCIVAAQSKFIGGSPFLQKSLKFSIHHPLKVTIKNFDCHECLQTLLDFFYEDVITVANEHEPHFKKLGKILAVTELMNLYEMHENENLIGEHNDSNETEANDPQNDVELGDENIFGEKRTYFKLTNPRANSSNNKINYCIACDFKCYRAKDMITHMSKCEPSHLTCSLCEIGFLCWREYNAHQKKHSNDVKKPFFCLECDVRFVTRAALLIHTPKHSTERSHICKHCNKGFKWKQGLTNHLLVHTNSKRMLCDICGFSTGHLKSLNAHKLQHAGEYFKCPYPECTLKTNRKENLKSHIETHKQERKFICEVCGFKFSQNKNLKRHVLKHSVEHRTKYKCPLCTFGTHRLDKLKEHMQRAHKGKENVTVELPEIFENSFDCQLYDELHLPAPISTIHNSPTNDVVSLAFSDIIEEDDILKNTNGKLMLDEFDLPLVENSIDVIEILQEPTEEKELQTEKTHNKSPKKAKKQRKS